MATYDNGEPMPDVWVLPPREWALVPTIPPNVILADN